MAASKELVVLLQTLTILAVISHGLTQVLTPPYFNLAVGRQIEATATCGVGVAERELFCKLTGANPDTNVQYSRNYEVIQGQLCDYCDVENPAKMHPPEFAIDGTERWWQSPPLSRGLELNAINLTVNLGQEFHVAYVFLRMANSPRPGVFALERSTDYGETYQAWQYFADSKSACNQFFGGDNYEERITRDDSVVCTTDYSKVVPLEGGEIVVSLVNNRPSANNFSYSQTLQDWTKATNIRLRLLRTKTLLGHLMAVARQDPTVTRRYYYSIKDISLGGRCVCNGHADVCDKRNPLDQSKLLCQCQHNTCGDQCEQCCEGFVQKPWRPATLSDANECEPCQCYEHTDECIYDEQVALNQTSIDIHGNYEGGGVCQNCRHNTMGINCEKCIPGYYRMFNVPLNSPDVCTECQCDPFFSTGDCEEGSGRCFCKPEFSGPSCRECSAGFFGWPQCQPCECNVNGTRDQLCEAGGGQCPCKVNYAGVNCDQCADGYYGFPECRPCECDGIGSLTSVCDAVSGECACRSNYEGRDCSSCARGFYDYPSCDLCDCDPTGSLEDICDQDTGTCLCRDNFSGSRCEQCAPGFFSYPDCIECGCAEPGSVSSVCDQGGQCMCEENYSGVLCDSCAPGYYKYPECLPCNCDRRGAYGVTCDQESGQCTCRLTFEGLMCDRCKPNFYNYPICEACTCNPAGAKEVPGYPLGGCGAHDDGRLCECKDRVIGRICDMCQETFYNLNANNPLGCEECDCHLPGTIGGNPVCDTVTGQCTCKSFVTGRRCEECSDGTYDLTDFNPFGCIDCDCDMGGSISPVCDKVTGQCPCRPRVTGRRCDMPVRTHFFTNLYHIKYEMEEGYTTEGGRVRYGFDSSDFENFSWRGYAIYSQLQKEVLVNINVDKPSLYRIIFRYVNQNEETVKGDVSVTPQESTDVKQQGEVFFSSTDSPQFATVSSLGVATSFVLNPGRWTISLATPQNLLVDYVVLLPQDYYEGGILQRVVNRPCEAPATEELCRHYVYINVDQYGTGEGSGGYIRTEDGRERTQMFPDREVGNQLGNVNMAHLNPNQTSMYLNVPIPNPGRYIFVISYYNRDGPTIQNIDVEITSPGSTEQGYLRLPSCPYSSFCRQVITDENGLIRQYVINGTYATLFINGEQDIDVAIDSVTAIPVIEWNTDLLKPSLECIRQNGDCVDTSFFTPTGSIRTEIEAGENENLISTDTPPSIDDIKVKVIKLDQELPSVNIDASVSNPGSYVFITHYYQPYGPGFSVPVTVNVDSTTIEGNLEVDYCPSRYGCKSVVTFPNEVDMQSVELPSTDISVTFNNTEQKPFFIDYFVVVPSVQYNVDVLDVQGVDKSVEFILKCGTQDFYVDPETEGECRDLVYSLAVTYNNGALECGCSTEGSTSFLCNPFGGQCQCRPNIIGRTCSQCRTGYYGFPNCRPCDCPSTGLCDPVSGQCVCPPLVTGANCDMCLPQTYGYDRFIGCELCNCNPDGVDGTLDCSLETGQCNCRPNIGGRRCDQCLDGYYAFPDCLECSCDVNGTMEEICHKDSAQCVCKENVGGENCDECHENSFYLERRNELGCTSCFCFHMASTCRSSDFFKTQVTTMDNWAVTNILEPFITQHSTYTDVRVTPDNVFDENLPIYWMAPADYLGNKVTSYGGQLKYTVRFRLPRSDDYQSLTAPDVRIEGNNFTIIHRSVEQPEANVPWTVELDMLESRFVHEYTGAPVGREQFMMALQNIEVLHIRGSYYTNVNSVRLSDVSLDIATEDGEGEQALNVEQCDCPPNYIGTSCETCAPGYFRSRTGPYLGVCVPCQCNNRADVCNPETGVCTNCRDNFEGPQCLSCKPGHYYNERSGVCEMCACPIALESNNFADSCQVSEVDGRFAMRCYCDEGYIGQRCQMCDYGYWGKPTVVGDSCKLCQCNGNIDINDRTSCDINTGACMKCLNNTTGDNCERCADWYFGDAVYEKNCMECDCDMHGSARCDYRTGSCLCKPNVVGAQCERCAPESFGFENDPPCQNCYCAEAAVNNSCDVESGRCTCQPGVTGRRCEQCERGYWNYGPNGCTKCQCEFEGAVTCDPVSGRCQCLPGVTGPKCDQCLPRWALIPEQGCFECDNCIDLLLDDSELVLREVTTMVEELESVSVGQGAIRRLEGINDTIAELRPAVDDLITDPTDPGLLDPLVEELVEVQRKSNEVRNKADRSIRESSRIVDDADYLLSAARDLQVKVMEGEQAANSSVLFAEDVLNEIISNIEAKNVEALLQEAEDILVEINARNFTGAASNAENEYTLAIDLLDRARMLYNKGQNQSDVVDQVTANVPDFLMKFQDLINNSQSSLETSGNAAALNMQNRDGLDDINRKKEAVMSGMEMTQSCVGQSNGLIYEANMNLADANRTYQGLEGNSSVLDAMMVTLSDFVEELGEENVLLRPLVDNATEHANSLEAQADFLESLIADTRESAEGALNASNAYQAIVDAITAASNASEDAITSAEEALNRLNGLADEARASRNRSEVLSQNASDTAYKVNNVLPDKLQQAIDYTAQVALGNEVTMLSIAMISTIENLPEDGYSAEAEVANSSAIAANEQAQQAYSRVQGIVAALEEDQQKMQQIQVLTEQANSGIVRAQANVNGLVDLIPRATELFETLEAKARAVALIGGGLKTNISALRREIDVARGQSSLIKVGMTFNKESTLQLRNPRSLSEAGSHSELSMFFKTQSTDGFLAYIGPDRRTIQQIDDYMSLELIDGQVQFRFDLGNGPGILTSVKNVSDGKWHEVIAERTSKIAKLTIRTPDEDDVMVSDTSPGSLSVLDLDPLTTKFYVGGVPGAAGLENLLGSTRFVGEIEEVKFGGVEQGLWDYIKGSNNAGAVSRKVLKGVTMNGYLFDGDGYVILRSNRFNNRGSTSVTFAFKTFEPNGLLFLIGKAETLEFLSVELREGRVRYMFDLGSNPAEVETTNTYNDGQWHNVRVIRQGKVGLLQVDEDSESDRSPGRARTLEIDPDIFIGGTKDAHAFSHVSQQAFKGCIKDLVLGSLSIRMADNEEAKGVTPGCSQMARVASFDGEIPNSHIVLGSQNIGQDFQLTMKVKSTESEGLLFYTSDSSDTQSNALSISLVDGQFNVVATLEGERSTVQTALSDYSDGRWHYLSVSKTGADLRVDVDDKEMVSTEITGERDRIDTSGMLYFGGVPSSVTPVEENVGSQLTFIGCLGDVTVNGNFKNFAEIPPSSIVNTSLAGCPLPDNVVGPPTLPQEDQVAPTAPVIPDVEEGQCALPIMPADNGEGDLNGTRYGISPESRSEYDINPSDITARSDFTLDFKTLSSDGVILYVSNEEHVDFIGLYLKNGQVYYRFNCGSGIGELKSSRTYNDGMWHTVMFSRDKQNGQLLMDNEVSSEGSAPGEATSINVNNPVSVGGLSDSVAEAAINNLDGVTSGFVGCVKNVRMFEPLPEPTFEAFTQPCSTLVEAGTFFSSEGGYITLKEQFSVGHDLDIGLDIKPRSQSGVLLSVVSDEGDFLALQLVNGQLVFNANNGQGEIMTKFMGATSTSLCDGNWHTIRAVKAANVVTLTVDGERVPPGIGSKGSVDTNTRDPLYIGGVPVVHPGIKTQEQYVGCVRKLLLRSEIQNLASGTASGDGVRLNTCPTN